MTQDLGARLKSQYIVTGGAGFIGSSLCARLLAQGNRVTLVDNFNDSYPSAWKRRYVAELLENYSDSLQVIEHDISRPPQELVTRLQEQKNFVPNASTANVSI